MRLRDRSALGLGLALVGAASHALAQGESPPLQIALEYQADPALNDCPSAAELSATVGKQLGFNPFVAAAIGGERRVKVMIERTPHGTEAHLQWCNERGESEAERSLTSESQGCAEIARGLAFAIAVRIQLRADVPARAPTASPPSRTPVSPAAPAPAQSRPVLPAAPRAPLLVVGAGLVAENGLTPQSSPGLHAIGALAGPRISFVLSAEATAVSRLKLADGTGFTARELGAKFALCARIAALEPCAVGMVAQLSVRGLGVDRVYSSASPIAAGGARLLLLLPASPRFATLLQAEALIIATPRVVVLNGQDVWSTAHIAFDVSLDVGAIFR